MALFSKFSLKIALTVAALGSVFSGVAAGDVMPVSDHKANNAAVSLTYEEWDLPAGEVMGMAGIGLRHKVSDYFSMGITSWAAVRGERGGFITVGVDGLMHYPVTDALDIEAGVHFGGGGGRGGRYLSGGGLLLRTHAGLGYHLGDWGRLGAGVSYVDFPNDGVISGFQPYVSFSTPFYFPLEAGWGERAGGRVSGSVESSRPHSMAVIARHLQVPSSVTTDTGRNQDDLTLLGVEWRTYLDDNWYAKLETEGAAGGNSTGYMQILAGLGYRLPITGNLYACADASIGGGGGGGVDSGGGLLLDGSAGLQLFLSDHIYTELSGGYLTATSESFKAGTVSLMLGYQAGGTGSNRSARLQGNGNESDMLRVRLVNQTYFKADDNWRSFLVDENVENLGVQIDYFPGERWYVTGQALAAYEGGAGSYMIGLVGGGLRQPLAGRFYLNAEALAGAAGGGGLAMGSGLVWQGNAGIGYQFSPAISALVTAGRLQAFNGDFKSNVLGLSLACNLQNLAGH